MGTGPRPTRPATAVGADAVRRLIDNGLGVPARTDRIGGTAISEARLGAEQWYEE